MIAPPPAKALSEHAAAMWTTFFGDGAAEGEPPAVAAPGPADSPTQTIGLDAAAPAAAGTPPKPSDSQPPRSNKADDSSVSAEIEVTKPSLRSSSWRSDKPTPLNHAEATEDQTAIAMLLKRLNQLMVKAGEHEFEKRTLVDGMEKERERLTAQIMDLERQVQDLKDQNVQLQYKIEYNSEPMLEERLQDAVDMRDALTGVKKELERQVEEKEAQLVDCKKQLAVKEEELKLAQQALAAEEAAKATYVQQIEEQQASLTSLEALRDSLQESLAEKDQQLESMKTEHNLILLQKEQEQAQLTAEVQTIKESSQVDLAALKTALEQTAMENEQQLTQLRAELEATGGAVEQSLRSRIAELEATGGALEQTLRSRITELEVAWEAVEQSLQSHVTELEGQVASSETALGEVNQELNDYKHDCVELWKVNEDLKQQIALASAETMLKNAELRENALSGQTALQEKVSDLENQLETMQERLNEKTQEVANLQLERRATNSGPPSSDMHQPWKDGAIRVLTDQVAAAQRELSDAMELNLHLSNRNTWLEEQHAMLSSSTPVNKNPDVDTQHHDARIYELTNENDTLKYQLAELQRALEETQYGANEVHQKLSELSLAHSAAVQEVNILKTSLSKESQKDEIIRRLESELADLQSSNNWLNDELVSLQGSESQLSEASSFVADLQQKLSMALVEKASISNELDVLKVSHSEFTKTTEEQNALAQNLRSEYDNLRITYDSLESAAAAKSKENEHLRAQISQYQRDEANVRASLTTEKEGLLLQITASQVFMSEAQQKIAELNAVNDAQKAEIGNLQHQLKNIHEVTEEANAKYEEVLRDLDGVDIQLQTKINECEKLRQDLTEAVQLSQQSTILQRDLDQAKTEISDLMSQIEVLKSSEETLKNQVQEVNRSNETVMSEALALKAERQAIEGEVNRLKEAMYQERNSFQTKYREVSERAQVAVAASADLQCENDDLSKKVNTFRSKGQQLEQQYKATRSEFEKTRTQLETITKKNLSLMSAFESAREESEQKEESTLKVIEGLKASQSELQREIAALKQSLLAKDAEAGSIVQHSQTEIASLRQSLQAKDAQISSMRQQGQAKIAGLKKSLQTKDAESSAFTQQSQTEIQKLTSILDKFKAEKEKTDSELKKLSSEVEEVRAEATAKVNAEIEMSRQEFTQLQNQLEKAVEDKRSLEWEISDLRLLEQEKAQMIESMLLLEQGNKRLEESKKELESALDRSKAFCEDLSRRYEEKIRHAENVAKQAKAESQAKIAQVSQANESLKHEIEKIAQSRFDQAASLERLEVQVAEVQAENNILSARAHRLTQQLSQFTELPAEDVLADSQSQTPDLWELLSSGMEQLKADLELASKYAASIDSNSLEVAEGEEALAIASVWRNLAALFDRDGLFISSSHSKYTPRQALGREGRTRNSAVAECRVRNLMLAMETMQKSRLIEAKQRRQEAVKDALLLKNRIALLKAEEEKAWKKIEQTRKRAAELIKLREDSERSQATLREMAHIAEKELQVSIQAKRELVLSIDSIQKKKEMSWQMTEARRVEALQLKEEKQRWKERTDRQKQEDLLDAIRRKEEVVSQKETLKIKKMLQKQEIEKLTKERAMDKVRAEEEQIRQRELEVQEMERLEMELIQRLRSTQHLQKQAFEELEAALTGTTGSPNKDAHSPHR